MPQSIYKVPNGKLLKLFFTVENNLISQITISGDFFLYPEESITFLEQALLNQPLDEKILKDRLDETLEKNKIELFGLDSASIVHAITIAQ